MAEKLLSLDEDREVFVKMAMDAIVANGGEAPKLCPKDIAAEARRRLHLGDIPELEAECSNPGCDNPVEQQRGRFCPSCDWSQLNKVS